MRIAPLFFAAVLAACSDRAPRVPRDGGPVDFVIGGLEFHLSDGVAVTSGGALTLHLSDQPDACLAFRQVPVGRAITFSLRVAAQTDGTTRAAVVPPKSTPAPGEAVGGIVRATGGVKNASFDAVSGSVAWTANSNGSVSLISLDVGFGGIADRLTTSGLLLAACAP
jgi:hypothetical protein